MAEFFAGGEEVRGAAVWAVGGEDGAGGDVPCAVGLDEDKIPLCGHGGDAADEAGLCDGGLFFFLGLCGFLLWGFVGAGG